jgi:hypothetical protein
LIIYSLVNAYKSQRGQRLAHLGIRRWREKQMGQSIYIPPVVLMADFQII